MSQETKYYCDFKGCGKEITGRSFANHIKMLTFETGIASFNICPEHAKYIFELFEKEGKEQ